MYFAKLKQPMELARAEIKALCEAYGAKCRFAEGYAILEGKIPFERLVYSKFACETINPCKVRGSFKIEGTKKEITEFAPKFSGKVDLESPKNVIRVWNKKTGREVWHYKNFRRNFPFRHHLTLDSKLARFLVNLSRVRENQKLLDPFCGSGSILIEAGKAGARVFGSDIDGEMVFCAEKNLQANKIKAKLAVSDILLLKPRLFCPWGFARGVAPPLFDAVVADLPYGRASSLHGKKKKKIYGEAFAAIPKVLKKGKCAVLLSDCGLKTKKLKQIAHYGIRVHKSLTRHVNVFRNA